MSVQCLKLEHGKRQVTQICLNRSCKDNSLCCPKCMPLHEQHSRMLINFTMMEALLANAKKQKLTEELLRNYLIYKNKIILLLTALEERLNAYAVVKNQLDLLVQTNNLLSNPQSAYQDILRQVSLLMTHFLYDPDRKQLYRDYTSSSAKSKLLDLTNILNALAMQGQGLGLNQQNFLPSGSQIQSSFHLVKRYESLSKDTDGSETIKQVRNSKLLVASFKALRDCQLHSVYLPFLVKNSDVNYQTQDFNYTLRLHLNYDLSHYLFSHKYTINHQKSEKASQCYALKIPEPLNLTASSVYTVSLTVEETLVLSYAYASKSEPNSLIEFLYPSAHQYKIASAKSQLLDDYGYFPYLGLLV